MSVSRFLPEYSHLLLVLSRYVGIASSEVRPIMIHRSSAVVSLKQVRTWPVAWMYAWPSVLSTQSKPLVCIEVHTYVLMLIVCI